MVELERELKMIILDIKKISKLSKILDGLELDDMDLCHITYMERGLFCRLPNGAYLEWDTGKERWVVVSGC